MKKPSQFDPKKTTTARTIATNTAHARAAATAARPPSSRAASCLQRAQFQPVPQNRMPSLTPSDVDIISLVPSAAMADDAFPMLGIALPYMREFVNARGGDAAFEGLTTSQVHSIRTLLCLL